MKHQLAQFSYRYGALIFIGLVLIFFSVYNTHFLTYNNITDILRSISIVTFVAIGITISLTVDGFDLSAGSTVSLTTVVSAAMMVWYQMPLIVVIIVPIILGILVGLLNSLLIVKIRIPDLLATLAVMYIISGIHRTYTKGYAIYNNMQFQDGTKAPGTMLDSFLWIGQGRLLGIPFPVILMILAVIGMHLFFKYTRGGRQMIMTGSNEEAARLSGLRVNRIRTLAYVASGIFAAIGGILFAARVGSGQVDAGSSMQMDALAAVFVGYSVFGAGRPNVIGTFFGAVLMGILVNGMTMLNVQYYATDIIKGAVLVLALAVTFVHRARQKV
ncbi:ABC transporter permease [Paenibacillus hunanensis]|uniref:Simple sugar transport system permease protein n=1 Tax=Paenibacillus hunanensis TaxID=539262 RepID=A0ABU1J3K8_9BACL|nr:ABC transporter permease [Paenibacillus hunanensis]MCL9662514.1 ABC transporter permease [Paenibacillus hunanensis]MDR6245840.1 simple sugar transport system permease protein [Paenibacillus hunanensis]WPP41305.1 ABC transporter permease [Paenibacillus hunanensis]GGJ16423.1 ribose ABC transporter permease [Paenibacillus hunanensis]